MLHENLCMCVSLCHESLTPNHCLPWGSVVQLNDLRATPLTHTQSAMNKTFVKRSGRVYVCVIMCHKQ